EDIRARAARQGRDPETVKIFFGLQVVLGHSRDEAEAKHAWLRDRMPVEACLTIMSGHIGIDFSKYPLDSVLDGSDPGAVGIRGLFDSLLVSTDGKPVTLRTAAQRYGMGLGAPVAVGTPRDVADRMEQLIDEGSGDGFMIMSTYMPGSFQEFVDGVIPELQRRERFRTRYTGRTLRDHLLEY
ncbi:MAG: LLM class flavin-dependent oxidoreductase, partial [Burkholderiales bacterium]|nr:LLM class flavin-dependent oxidoreductase [Burkholderiales bacterium]